MTNARPSVQSRACTEPRRRQPIS